MPDPQDFFADSEGEALDPSEVVPEWGFDPSPPAKGEGQGDAEDGDREDDDPIL